MNQKQKTTWGGWAKDNISSKGGYYSNRNAGPWQKWAKSRAANFYRRPKVQDDRFSPLWKMWARNEWSKIQSEQRRASQTDWERWANKKKANLKQREKEKYAKP